MRYYIATQQTDSGGLNTVEDQIVTRYLAKGNHLVTSDESEARSYHEGDALAVRDDLNGQFPFYRFYLVEVADAN